ncbi:hypothetical protein [Streptomyces sp. ODS28]|uniref:hypothetical protein n=1 Tax=Streptomyces sp. ODS28 TaxID=3136688 RepID=UPI0031E4F19F
MLRARPSALVPPDEVKCARFDRLTDRRIVRCLRALRGGVLITTRPALNLLSARFTDASVVRVGQEHLHYAHHKPALAQEIDHWYAKLDALTVLNEADLRVYADRLAGGGVRSSASPTRSPTPPRPARRCAGR